MASEERSPIATGIEWATRIMVVGFTGTLPILAGVGVDRWLGSKPIGMLVGLGLGFVLGLIQFVRLVSDLRRLNQRGASRQANRPVSASSRKDSGVSRSNHGRPQ